MSKKLNNCINIPSPQTFRSYELRNLNPEASELNVAVLSTTAQYSMNLINFYLVLIKGASNSLFLTLQHLASLDLTLSMRQWQIQQRKLSSSLHFTAHLWTCLFKLLLFIFRKAIQERTCCESKGTSALWSLTAHCSLAPEQQYWETNASTMTQRAISGLLNLYGVKCVEIIRVTCCRRYSVLLILLTRVRMCWVL
jgi:hypothetical protein